MARGPRRPRQQRCREGLRRLMDEVNVLLPDGTPFVVVNLAEWEQPSYANDMEAALFGEGQRPR